MLAKVVLIHIVDGTDGRCKRLKSIPPRSLVVFPKLGYEHTLSW